MVDLRHRALDWLELVASREFMNHLLLVRDPFLEGIRSSERFEELVVRMKRVREEFAV